MINFNYIFEQVAVIPPLHMIINKFGLVRFQLSVYLFDNFLQFGLVNSNIPALLTYFLGHKGAPLGLTAMHYLLCVVLLSHCIIPQFDHVGFMTLVENT